MLKYNTTGLLGMQEIFSQNSCFFLCVFRLFSKSSVSFRRRRIVPALEGLINQNDVVAKPRDAVPRYVVILSPAEQAKETAGAKYNERLYLSLRDFQLQIADIAKTASVADVDDLFAPQHRKPIHHIFHLGPLYERSGSSYAKKAAADLPPPLRYRIQ
jgi:hypothetical protein